MVKKNSIPDDAPDLLKDVLGAIRKGHNPDHARLQKLDHKQRKEVQKAVDKAARKRKGSHRAGGDDVINTGMFD